MADEDDDIAEGLDYGEDSAVCDSCKKRRGAKKLIERLSPDELSIEQERTKAQIESVLALRHHKQVPPAQAARMNELRFSQGMTLKEIVAEIEQEYGDRWTQYTVIYHTDPKFRDKVQKYNEEYGGKPERSEQSQAYTTARTSLFQHMAAVGYTDEEIRNLLDMHEYQSRDAIEKADSTFLAMSPQTLKMVTEVKAIGELSSINRKLAETQLSVNAVMIVKRQLEEAGMNDIAKEISLPLIKRVKKEDKWATDIGGWDRIGDEEEW